MSNLLHDIHFDALSQTLLLRNDLLTLEFDRANGAWTALKAPGLVYRLPPVPSFAVRIENAWMTVGSDSFERYEIGISRAASSAHLSLFYKLSAGCELVETFTLFPEKLNVERTMRLIRLSGEGAVKLNAFRFILPDVKLGDPADCVFDSPGPFPAFDYYKGYPLYDHQSWLYLPARTPMTRLLDCSHTLGSAPDWGFGLMAISHPDAGLCLATWMDTGGEINYRSEINGGKDCLTLIFDDLRSVRLLPGMVVESDVQHIVITPGLPAALQLYRQMVEISMPAAPDMPEWIPEMVILEAMPSGFKGGFKEIDEKLPFYRDLGINTLYLMPHWLGGYGNTDMYSVDPRFGTPKELKSLTAKAHELGMRVLFDMVIHGIDQQSAIPQQRPDLFIKNEDGSLALHEEWKTVSTDWASPAYQVYMADIARHHVEDYGIDGYRLDAAAYKNGSWHASLPYPAYRAGSAAVDLMRAMLAAMRELKPEAVILNEVFGPAFYQVCDLVHDNMTMGPTMFLEAVDAGEATAESYKLHLADVYDCLPEGAPRVMFTRNHDSSWFYHFNGYTKRTLALDAINAFFGIPEFFSGDPQHSPLPEDDPAVLDHYRHIWGMRRLFPELRRGKIFLREVRSSQEMVFAGARQLGERLSVVVVSLSEQLEEVQITLELDLPPIEMQAFDAATGAPVPCRLMGSTLELTLQPCQAVVARWG